MAISTSGVFLMKKAESGSTWDKLINIISFPDLGGSTSQLDVTTLSDSSRRYIPGLEEVESLEFKTNYDLGDYKKVSELSGVEYQYAVWIGGTENNGVITPTGVHGRFEFSGYISATVNSGDVNKPIGMTVKIMPSTKIVQNDNKDEHGG